MKLVVLAADDSSVPFVTAAAELPVVSIVAAWAESPEVQSLVTQHFPDCEWLRDPAMSPAREFDALLVAGAHDEIRRSAAIHAAAGRRILVVTDVVAGPEDLFRLTSAWQEHPQLLVPLYRDDVAAGLRAHLPGKSNNEADEQRQPANPPPGPLPKKGGGDDALRAVGPAGLLLDGLWKIEFHRALSPGEMMSPQAIDRRLLQDLYWIRRELGEYEQITLRTSANPSGEVLQAEVILLGENLPEFRWLLRPQGGPPDWQAMLFAGQTSTGIAGNDGRIAGARRQLQFIADRIRSQQPLPDWTELMQLGQIVAVARRSLLKRRTLDIQLEEASEIGQFKSQMTAIGCGVLLWVMFGMIGLLTVGGIIDPRDSEYRQSKSAGFILANGEFANAGDGVLTARGREHLAAISEKWSSTSPVLIIESAGEDQPPEDARRQGEVVQLLESAGRRDADSRVVVRPLPGKWFERFMLLGWGIVFGPVAIVLGLQLLIFAARRGGGGES